MEHGKESYLTDEELERLIAQVEQEPVLQAPSYLKDEILNSLSEQDEEMQQWQATALALQRKGCHRSRRRSAHVVDYPREFHSVTRFCNDGATGTVHGNDAALGETGTSFHGRVGSPVERKCTTAQGSFQFAAGDEPGSREGMPGGIGYSRYFFNE